MVPSFVLLIILVISWKKPYIGGSIFILISIAFTLFFRTYRTLPTFLAITLPVALVGILFILLPVLARKKPKGAA